MRPQTQKRIDALHAEIARLVQMEKDYVRRKKPNLNEFQRSVVECSIEVHAWPPLRRALHGISVAKDQTP